MFLNSFAYLHKYNYTSKHVDFRIEKSIRKLSNAVSPFIFKNHINRYFDPKKIVKLFYITQKKKTKKFELFTFVRTVFLFVLENTHPWPTSILRSE